MAASTKKIVAEEVLRELAPIGKYRVRLLLNPKTKAKLVDVREYVEADTFSGYTRRGIRLTLEQAQALASTLREVHDGK